MPRVLRPARTLTPPDLDRARIEALVARQPATVVVSRLVGDGLTGPKTRAVVATFTARVDTLRVQSDPTQPAFTTASETVTLTTLRDNDRADRSGNPVAIERQDFVVATEVDGLVRTFVAGGVLTLRTHLEVQLDARD